MRLNIKNIRQHPKVYHLPKEDQDIVVEFATILHRNRKLGALRLAELCCIALTLLADYEYYPRQRANEKVKAYGYSIQKSKP